MAQERKAAIVGIREYPLRVAPGVSAMEIKVESIRRALEDAGLGLVEQALGGLRLLVAALHDLRRHGDQPALHRLVAHDAGVAHHVRGGGLEVEELGQREVDIHTFTAARPGTGGDALDPLSEGNLA